MGFPKGHGRVGGVKKGQKIRQPRKPTRMHEDYRYVIGTKDASADTPEQEVYRALLREDPKGFVAALRQMDRDQRDSVPGLAEGVQAVGSGPTVEEAKVDEGEGRVREMLVKLLKDIEGS